MKKLIWEVKILAEKEGINNPQALYEDTIKLLREKAPKCKVAVGGAVLTKEYADSIGADKYGKDAMEAVRYAEEINRLL